MVERSQTAGWLPSLYEPIKKAGQKIANWFAPRADASVTPEAYEITMELPGVTAGIDLMLAFVEEDLGHAAAMWVARYLVVYLKRPGGQAQFSDVLRLQTKDAVFDRLHSWIAEHLANDLSVDALARQAGMGGRTFARRYRAVVGHTPARAVERLCVEAARHLLSTGRLPIKRVAQRRGFGSEETMRRSFLRQMSITPQDYRKHFAATAKARVSSG